MACILVHACVLTVHSHVHWYMPIYIGTRQCTLVKTYVHSYEPKSLVLTMYIRTWQSTLGWVDFDLFFHFMWRSSRELLNPLQKVGKTAEKLFSVQWPPAQNLTFWFIWYMRVKNKFFDTIRIIGHQNAQNFT
jgi:hypothetical protein